MLEQNAFCSKAKSVSMGWILPVKEVEPFVIMDQIVLGTQEETIINTVFTIGWISPGICI